ncbi:MAG: DUF4372 domain-containing protein [Thermodesulfobacteriota bacterium]
MIRYASLFSQRITCFNRNRFYHVVLEHRSERYAKGYNPWDHGIAIPFCRLVQAKGLREICRGLACCLGKLRHPGMRDAPHKSTLSCVNAHRPWELFRDLFSDTLAVCKSAAPRKQTFRFKNKLLSLDSTTISLCVSLFPWATFRRTKGSVKLHVLPDHDGYISNRSLHDVTITRNVWRPCLFNPYFKIFASLFNT